MNHTLRFLGIAFLISGFLGCAQTAQQAYHETAEMVRTQPIYSEPMLNLYEQSRLKDAEERQTDSSILKYLIVPGPEADSPVFSDLKYLYDNDKITVDSNKDLVPPERIEFLERLESRAVYDVFMVPRLRLGTYFVIGGSLVDIYDTTYIPLTSLEIDFRLYDNLYAGAGATFISQDPPHTRLNAYVDGDFIMNHYPFFRTFYAYPAHENWRPYAGIELSYITAEQRLADRYYTKSEYTAGIGRSVFLGVQASLTNFEWLLYSPLSIGFTGEIAYYNYPFEFDYFGGPNDVHGIALNLGVDVQFYSFDFSRVQ